MPIKPSQSIRNAQQEKRVWHFYNVKRQGLHATTTEFSYSCVKNVYLHACLAHS